MSDLKNLALNSELKKHEDLVSAVQAAFDIDLKSLLSKTKVRSACEPRMVLMWLLRQRGLSFPLVGAALKRNHATIISACQRVEENPRLLIIAKKIASDYGLTVNQQRELLHQQRLKLWRELCGIDLKRRVVCNVY